MKNQGSAEGLMKNRVFPIVISTPFAVGDVYSYLIKDEKNVLVDCGHSSESSYQQVKKGLQTQGLCVEDIDEIWLTHGHPDHFGQAALLAERAGATVKGHLKERGNFAARNNSNRFETFFNSHNIPLKHIKLMTEQLGWLEQFQERVEPEWVEEGAKLSSGILNFQVKHAPGHAPGHVVFYSEEGLTFGGDVLLDHISTNALINFDPDTGERNKSLLQYRDTLKWMQNRRGIVLPGHGKQIKNVWEVATKHLMEQHKRFNQIKEELQNTPQSLMQLSQTIFGDALQRGEHFLVFSEVLGYLDWGEAEGTIKKEKTDRDVKFKLE